MSTAVPLPPASATPRPSVIQLAIKEKAALYAAYIALFADGGIFIPSTRDYKLGDDVYVLLSLPDDPQRYPVAGKVAWVTPPKAAANAWTVTRTTLFIGCCAWSVTPPV